jgi:hypothetical protein
VAAPVEHEVLARACLLEVHRFPEEADDVGRNSVDGAENLDAARWNRRLRHRMRGWHDGQKDGDKRQARGPRFEVANRW